MKKDFKYSINQGLPGGANELKKFVQGSISVTGYKSDSPDVNNDFNIIPSNRITMQGVNFPVLGVDDFGYEQMMMPGGEYSFPGNYVTEIPQMGKGGLTQWFAEEWTDVKTGKKCGRSSKEKGSRPYPACRPKKRVNETTPKTTSEMSAAEKEKFKREKTSGKRINYNHKRKEFGGETGWLDQYQVGGNYAGQDLIKKSGDWYTTQEWDDAIPDSTFENIVEFFDVTGYTSHDDARRAHREWKASGSTYPSLEQGLDMFGAVPGLGKLAKIKYLAKPTARLAKAAYKYFPWQQALNAVDTVQDEYENKHGGWLDSYQDGGNIDPEFMFKNKYNTELTPSEEADFSKWTAKESERQGRDILNDIGAYDVKGFWKSGDYKNMDSDNHGTDTWKKPNHPTFSNQSRYHGADGWYGGNWTDKAGYQPSKQTLETYGPDYYDWMFKSEPGRSEHLDISRYKSGANAPTPFVYQKGGRTPIYVSNPNDPRLRSYGDSLNLYNLNKNNIKDLKYIEDEYGYDRNLYDANWNKFTKNWDKTKGPKSTIAFDNLTKLNKEFPTPYREYTSVLDSRNTVFEFKKPVQPVQYKPLQRQVSYPNQTTGRGMTRTISKNVESKLDPKVVAKQQQLIDAGYNIGTADGIWGSKSQKAWDQMSTPKQFNTDVSFTKPIMSVRGVAEENVDTLKKQYKENTGSNFKSQDNVFNNLQKSLGRRPTVTEYNRAVQQYNNSNRSMKHGGWLNKYQPGGELPELNSKMDVANFYKNPLSEKYGIAQNPDTGSFEYYLKSGQSSDPVKQEIKELESQNLRKAYVPSLSEEVSRISDVVLPEVKQQQSRSKNIEKTYELERQKDFIDSQLYNESMGPNLDPASLPVPSYSGMNPIQEYYANLLYDKYGKFVVTDKGENKTFYGTKTKDGDWDLNSFEVLTGRASDPRYQQVLKEELAQRRNDQYGITPIGVFPLSKIPNYYGSPGFKVEGSSLNPKVTVAYHTVFNPKKRLSLFENEDLADNYVSSGCINCKKPNLDALINFVGQNGLSATIDSRLPLDKNIEWTKKNTPKYKKWLDNYK